ncbi:hypothetical protein HK101_002439 [Irineochytrium annulatum]|nr:hypothetical protein HK101_002439 [Irineochytrium annulatum]
MLAFFGLPPFHKGDSSVNAVEAGLEFLRSWRKMEPTKTVSISLATGEILISVLGNEIRADSTGLGKRQAVGVWSLCEGDSPSTPAESKSKNTHQFGYVDERKVILEAVQSWVEGDSQLLVVVEGPSGVGKTSLMHSAMSCMEPNGVCVRFVLLMAAFHRV